MRRAGGHLPRQAALQAREDAARVVADEDGAFAEVEEVHRPGQAVEPAREEGDAAPSDVLVERERRRDGVGRAGHEADLEVVPAEEGRGALHLLAGVLPERGLAHRDLEAQPPPEVRLAPDLEVGHVDRDAQLDQVLGAGRQLPEGRRGGLPAAGLGGAVPAEREVDVAAPGAEDQRERPAVRPGARRFRGRGAARPGDDLHHRLRRARGGEGGAAEGALEAGGDQAVHAEDVFKVEARQEARREAVGQRLALGEQPSPPALLGGGIDRAAGGGEVVAVPEVPRRVAAAAAEDIERHLEEEPGEEAADQPLSRLGEGPARRLLPGAAVPLGVEPGLAEPLGERLLRRPLHDFAQRVALELAPGRHDRLPGRVGEGPGVERDGRREARAQRARRGQPRRQLPEAGCRLVEAGGDVAAVERVEEAFERRLGRHPLLPPGHRPGRSSGPEAVVARRRAQRRPAAGWRVGTLRIGLVGRRLRRRPVLRRRVGKRPLLAGGAG